MLNVNFWVVAPCGLVGSYKCEGGGDMYHRNFGNHLQDHKWHTPEEHNEQNHNIYDKNLREHCTTFLVIIQ
jgi:hypothetical protein